MKLRTILHRTSHLKWPLTIFDVGIDCLALILGRLRTLKSVRDKEEYALANQP